MSGFIGFLGLICLVVGLIVVFKGPIRSLNLHTRKQGWLAVLLSMLFFFISGSLQPAEVEETPAAFESDAVSPAPPTVDEFTTQLDEAPASPVAPPPPAPAAVLPPRAPAPASRPPAPAPRPPAPAPAFVAPPPAPVAPPPAVSGVFPNCSAARAAGADPVLRGEPGFGSHLDADDDGIGCE